MTVNRSDSAAKMYLGATLFGLVLLLVACIFLLSSVPPVSRDALTHHLAVPKLYLLHGGLYEIPDLVFSYYPMNLDLLYMIPLYFGNDLVPKFIHFTFALLTAWLVYSYVKRRLDGILALLAVLMFLSLPIVVKLSTTVYVDLGVVFFSTAAVVAFLRWMESGFRWNWLFLSAVCCGLAMGTKYNGLVVFFLMTLFVPFVYMRQRQSAAASSLKAIGWGAFFFITALLVFSPWMARNLAWKGNPIYPLYQSAFEHKALRAGVEKFSPADPAAVDGDTPADIVAEKTKRSGRGKLNHFAIRHLVFKESGWEIALVPLRIFFQGQDDDPKYFDGKLNPYLLLLPLFAFLGIRKDPHRVRTEKKALFFFAALYLAFAFFQVKMRIRYIAPIIPPLTILSVYGIDALLRQVGTRLTDRGRTVWTGAVALSVCLLIGLNGLYLRQQFQKIDPFSYLSGLTSRDAYITRFRPEYPVIVYANRHLPGSAKILALFLGNRRYYFDRGVLFSPELFRKYVIKAHHADQIGELLKGAGITHLILRYDLFDFWARGAFDEKEKDRVRMFLDKQTRSLFSEGGFGLHELLPAGGVR